VVPDLLGGRRIGPGLHRRVERINLGSMEAGSRVRHVAVGDLTIAYEQAGSGPPLLMLHGGLSDHREWRAQLDDLADTFTVVAWDAPGCGTSTVPPASFRMHDYADVCAGFIEVLHLDRPHVLGLSWGSTLALELYRRRPDLPRTLLLTAAYAGWAGSLPPDVVEERLAAAERDLSSNEPARMIRAWLPTLFTDRAPAEMLDDFVSTFSSFDPEGVRPMLRAMADADLRATLPTIAVPTLLLYGALDVRSPLAVAEEMRATIPGSTLVVMDDVGHQSNIETPETFNRAIRTFLDRTRA
jgi:pimeloyl-ACP methyl ester carboxylesterase